MPFPANKGDKLRALHQIKRLARNHSVTVACFVDDPQDMRHIKDLGQHCARVVGIPLQRSTALARGLLGLVCGGTITESFYRSQAMRDAIAKLCEGTDFDVVVAFSSGMAPYALRVTGARRILDLCDLDSAKWSAYAGFTNGPKRWLYRRESLRLGAKEREWLDAFDASILITPAEGADLDASSRRKLHFVTNGVEMPVRGLRNDEASAQNPNQAITIGFVGVMDYFPNVDAVCWFAESVWPTIHAALPGATFRIVGRAPTARVRRLDRQPGITVTGEVVNIADEIGSIDISVAPLRIARGLQNKVLEAMAMGTPVVLTSKAAEGIDASDGHDYWVRDDPAALADGVIELARQPKRRAELGTQGRQFVAAHHRWSDALCTFELLVTGATPPQTEQIDRILKQRVQAGPVALAEDLKPH
jgi:sugar transferase (PEP-CTERM/EpsH1 system associated)